MGYDIASDAWIGWGPETGTVTDAADNSAATLPTLPSFTIVGYNKLPTGKRGLQNSKGYSAGLAGAAYNKKGAVAPEISFEFRMGSIGLLAYCLRATEDDPLASVCIYEGVYGQWCNAYRLCKCSTLAAQLQSSNSQGGEISANATFWATARQALTTLPTVSRSLLRALGTPLFWHDFRQFTITNAAGTTADYRKGAASLSFSVNHNLERIGQRNNFGENNPLSRTCYEIREHTIAASGEATFTRKLPEALFTGAKNATDWGNIVSVISDTPALVSGTGKGFTLTATNCIPSDESGQGGEENSTLGYSLPFSSDNLLLTIE